MRILDLSGGAEEGITEEVAGFEDIEHANAFARAYVRDSIEVCRGAGMNEVEVMQAWLAFGEDALVVDADDEGWRSATEVSVFAGHPADPADRDWRALDPRLVEPDEDENEA